MLYATTGSDIEFPDGVDPTMREVLTFCVSKKKKIKKNKIESYYYNKSNE